MMSDVFSSFDPISFKLCYNYTLIILIPFLIMINPFIINYNMIQMSYIMFMKYFYKQLLASSMKLIKSMMMTSMMMFIMLIYMNLMGMIPYMFSITSHIIFTLSLGLPMWMSMIMSSFSKSMKKSIAHLLPDGAPIWLNPFLILIESISMCVRPLTLSFRLAANMTAGHVVLILMTSFSLPLSLNSMLFCPMIMMLSSMYMLFEFGICLIQAYIFCLLLSLYSNDHQM